MSFLFGPIGLVASVAGMALTAITTGLGIIGWAAKQMKRFEDKWAVANGLAAFGRAFRLAPLKLKVTGLPEAKAELSAGLRSAQARVGIAAAEAITEVTNFVLEESVKRAPHYQGNPGLESSHTKKVEARGSEVAGYVYIPTNSPAAEYAVYMHEGDYKLGERSQQKQAAQDAAVGRKFLERAIFENQDKIKAIIAAKLKKALS